MDNLHHIEKLHIEGFSGRVWIVTSRTQNVSRERSFETYRRKRRTHQKQRKIADTIWFPALRSITDIQPTH